MILAKLLISFFLFLEKRKKWGARSGNNILKNATIKEKRRGDDARG